MDEKEQAELDAACRTTGFISIKAMPERPKAEEPKAPPPADALVTALKAAGGKP